MRQQVTAQKMLWMFVTMSYKVYLITKVYLTTVLTTVLTTMSIVALVALFYPTMFSINKNTKIYNLNSVYWLIW